MCNSHSGAARDRAPRPKRTVLYTAMAAAAAMLCACAPAEPAPRPVLVQVPVSAPVYCKVAAPARPALAIASLNTDSPPADAIRAYVETVMILKSAVRQRDALLAACAGPPPDAAHDAPAK